MSPVWQRTSFSPPFQFTSVDSGIFTIRNSAESQCAGLNIAAMNLVDENSSPGVGWAALGSALIDGQFRFHSDDSDHRSSFAATLPAKHRLKAIFVNLGVLERISGFCFDLRSDLIYPHHPSPTFDPHQEAMNMRIILGILLSVCCLTNAANAEVVIDDFDQATTVNNNLVPANSGNPIALNDDLTGTRTVSVSPAGAGSSPNVQFSALGGGGGFNFSSNGAGGVVTLNYTGLNLSLTAGMEYLSLDIFNNVLGSWTATISTNGGAQTSGPVAVSAGAILDFEPGVALVSDIQVVLTSTSLGSIINNAGQGRIIANPEPASLALLGMTGLIGGVVIRRRRKAAESV